MIPTSPSLPMIDRKRSFPLGTSQEDLMEIVMIREMEQFIRRPIRVELEALVSMAVSVVRTKNHDMLRMLLNNTFHGGLSYLKSCSH